MNRTACLPMGASLLLLWFASLGFAEEKQAAPLRIRFDNYTVELPDGWNNTNPDRENPNANLVLSGKVPYDFVGSIRVGRSKPRVKNLMYMAKALAGKEGAIDDKQVDVDGVKAIRFTSKRNKIHEPQVGVIFLRNEMQYIAIGAGEGDFNATEAFDSFIASWKWLD